MRSFDVISPSKVMELTNRVDKCLRSIKVSKNVIKLPTDTEDPATKIKNAIEHAPIRRHDNIDEMKVIQLVRDLTSTCNRTKLEYQRKPKGFRGIDPNMYGPIAKRKKIFSEAPYKDCMMKYFLF